MGVSNSFTVCVALLVLAALSTGHLYDVEDAKSYYRRSILQENVAAGTETVGTAEGMESEVGEEEYSAIKIEAGPLGYTHADFLRYNFTGKDSLAVCNDGSPGMLYLRLGSSKDTDKWVIRLMGGAWCHDKGSCAWRWDNLRSLMSSSLHFWPNYLQAGAVSGILSNDPNINPHLSRWNHVLIPSCSSDAFLGDVGKGESPQLPEYHFRGQRIVTAAINLLLENHGLTQASDILLAGESSGGVGVLNRVDEIAELLKERAPGVGTFKALVDAGWFMDLPSFSADEDGDTYRRMAQLTGQNHGSIYNKKCAETLPGREWACFFAMYAWPHIKTPVFFHEMLYDRVGLQMLGGNSEAKRELYRQAVFTSLMAQRAEVGTPPEQVRWATKEKEQPTSHKNAQQRWKEATAHEQQNMRRRSLQVASMQVRNLQQERALLVQTAHVTKRHPGTEEVDLPIVFAPAGTDHNIIDGPSHATSHIHRQRFVNVLQEWFTGLRPHVHVIDDHHGIAQPWLEMELAQQQLAAQAAEQNADKEKA